MVSGQMFVLVLKKKNNTKTKHKKTQHPKPNSKHSY